MRKQRDVSGDPDPARQRQGTVPTEKKADGLQLWPTWGRNDEPPDCVMQAWELYCRGFDNWAQIAKTLGFEVEQARKKIKRDVIRLSKVINAAIDDPDGMNPRAEALTKYSRQVKELWKLYEEAAGRVDVTRDGDKVVQTVHPRNQRLRLHCLRQLAEVTEREAAIKGVVTKREAHETTDTNPVVPVYNVNIRVREPEPYDEDQPPTS